MTCQLPPTVSVTLVTIPLEKQARSPIVIPVVSIPHLACQDVPHHLPRGRD